MLASYKCGVRQWGQSTRRHGFVEAIHVIRRGAPAGLATGRPRRKRCPHHLAWQLSRPEEKQAAKRSASPRKLQGYMCPASAPKLVAFCRPCASGPKALRPNGMQACPATLRPTPAPLRAYLTLSFSKRPLPIAHLCSVAKRVQCHAPWQAELPTGKKSFANLAFSSSSRRTPFGAPTH
jgi:hypothetical protein